MSSITETYFPRLLEILEQDPSAAERLKLDCGMCYEEMTTDGVGKCKLPNGETRLKHAAYILPCGHIFGFSCVEELRHHSRQQHQYGKFQNSCPTCRHRQHFLPCGCPHRLGTLLQVEEANRQMMLDRIKEVEGMCNRCFPCELFSFAHWITEEADPSGGIAMEEHGWEDLREGEHPMIMMIFLKHSGDTKWRIDAFRIKNRLYFAAEMNAETRRRVDGFINDMAPGYFASHLESGEGFQRIVADVLKMGRMSRTIISHHA